MRTLTISLTQQQVERLQKAVESGAYASNSEVMREALRLWEQREDMRLLEMDRLRRAYEEGLSSGPGREISASDLLAELKSDARKRG